jgi:glycosyltransferase involved in cell wall biosynthesis
VTGPTLSLCVPAYNASQFLPRLLHSAAAQAAPFDETIVYDDCSTDSTAEVAAQLGATVVRGDVNVGCSAGKNRLLQASCCDWIHFHDADDELLANFSTLARRWINGPEPPDVVLFDYEYRDNDTHELIASSDFSPDELRDDPLRYAILHQINPFCGVYRRTRLIQVGGYDLAPDILYNEDVAFHCKLAAAGLSFGAEKEVSIVNYRVKGSMSGASQVKCLMAHHQVMRRLSEKAGGRYPQEIAFRLWTAATGLASFHEWQAADGALADAYRVFPHIPGGFSKRFTQLCRLVGPPLAFRIRERAIRLLQPGLR